MPGQVVIRDVFEMLRKCAEGYAAVPKKHHWWISFRGKTYRSFPIGKPHGDMNTSIEIGWARRLVRHLGIDRECAERFLRQAI